MVAGTNQCVGYLFNFTGKGIFSPDGLIEEVTPEQMETHNKLLSQAEIAGLDKCEIGQHGTFYYVNGKVSTFTGEVVSTSILRNGKSITFQRNGKKFRGTLQQDADCFNFKRIQ